VPRAPTLRGCLSPVRRQPLRRVPARPRRRSEHLLEGLLLLPDHRLLDRMIRGRLWIGLLAFALIGIVTMQLLVLKLNTGIGHSLALQSRLQRENATMSIENSTAAAGENIEPEASHKGMVLAPLGAIRFLSSEPRDLARAAAALRQPVATQTASTTSTASQSTTAVGESTDTETQTQPASTESATVPSSETSTATEAPPQSTPASTTETAGTQVASTTEQAPAATETPSGATDSAVGAPGGTAPPGQG
jgi:hypothetical protein